MSATGSAPTQRGGDGQDEAGLTLRGLGVRVGEHVLLDDVDLAVDAGAWLGLVGPNGAGKSTLLRAVAGLVRGRGSAVTGQVAAPAVAVVPQAPELPAGMSVVEYALLGRTAHLGWLAQESQHDRDVVVDVLRRLDLAPFAQRPVDGLSGGEAQRAVLARALVQQAPLLLLDEPTAALDVGHQVEVLELVDDLRRRDGLTVVSVMHDLSVAARYADRLALLHRGRLVAHDEPERVLDAALLSDVYGTSLAVHRLDGDLVVMPAPRTRAEGRTPARTTPAPPRRTA